MAGSTFQPPIHLDPTQDAPQQTAFINQNFLSLASALETNSFRVVSSGLTSVTGSGNPVDWATVPHNLGFAPVPFAFLNNVTISAGSTPITTNGNLPLPTWTSVTIDTVIGLATTSGNPLPVVSFKVYLQAVCDTTNLYIIMLNSTGAPTSPFSVQYYLTQQTAS